MEDIYGIHDTQTQAEKAIDMRAGANWFYWVAALAALNSFVVFFGWPFGFTLGFGLSQYIDTSTIVPGQESATSIRPLALAASLSVSAIFALFGYYARKGSDMAFVVGIFLYVADAMLILTYRDFYGFSFHILALFFIAKGLLASRRRLDPSV